VNRHEQEENTMKSERHEKKNETDCSEDAFYGSAVIWAENEEAAETVISALDSIEGFDASDTEFPEELEEDDHPAVGSCIRAAYEFEGSSDAAYTEFVHSIPQKIIGQEMLDGITFAIELKFDAVSEFHRFYSSCMTAVHMGDRPEEMTFRETEHEEHPYTAFALRAACYAEDIMDVNEPRKSLEKWFVDRCRTYRREDRIQMIRNVFSSDEGYSRFVSAYQGIIFWPGNGILDDSIDWKACLKKRED
jgi:hypothetical protein